MPPQPNRWTVVREVGQPETLYDGDDETRANAVFDRAGKVLKTGRVKLLRDRAAEAVYIGMKAASPILLRGPQAIAH